MTFELKNKGLIALDLDGTTVEGKNPPSKEVAKGLKSFSEEGWKIAFVTGRSLGWVKGLLKDLDFPYELAVQNGALGLSFPSGRQLFKNYLNTFAAEKANDIPLPYALYTGDEKDTVYWQPDRYSKIEREYLRSRIEAFQENWIDDWILPKEAAAFKWFGKQHVMEELGLQLVALGFQCTPIKDPFDASVTICQATHPKANKGEALRQLQNGVMGPTIAAGDDMNDFPLLQAADIAIAMPKAPEALRDLAHFIADRGLISALKEATK
ncbi:MAG: HAD-IIB family hydrolase [Chlamydiia bacterium]|nr:HAD-IIB family hydrolase [Chlamydiia bacterium]